MLEENPEFHIYGPQPFIFGGIKATPPYKSSDMFEEMPKILRSLGDSIEQAHAYNIETMVDILPNNLVSTKVSPLTASFDEKCIEYTINYRRPNETQRLAKYYYLRVRFHEWHTALFSHKNGLYVVHVLMKRFNTEMTEFLLKEIEKALLHFLYDKFRVTSNILDDVLKVDAEVIPPDTSYFI